MPALQRDKTPLRAELTHGYYEDWPRERYLNVMAKETEEMLKTGVVTLCCPECNEPTAVNRNSCGAWHNAYADLFARESYWKFNENRA